MKIDITESESFQKDNATYKVSLGALTVGVGGGGGGGGRRLVSLADLKKCKFRMSLPLICVHVACEI